MMEAWNIVQVELDEGIHMCQMRCISKEVTVDNSDTLRELLVLIVDISAAFPDETRRRQEKMAKDIIFY